VGYSSTITGRRPEVAQRLEPGGFYWSGLLCLVAAALKLTVASDWSWWRVFLPFWAVLGHNLLYITVGFVWFSFADHGATGEEITIRQGHGGYGYQLVGLVCFVVFADNLLRRVEGPGETIWFAVSSGRWELILLSAILSVLLQLLFWSEVVASGSRQTH
jgi:hypothetical protein